MQDILAAIDRALKERGISARRASLLGTSDPSAIRDMRRGRVPSVERIRALCAALDLEFYVGPRRHAEPGDTALTPGQISRLAGAVSELAAILDEAERVRPPPDPSPDSE